MIHSPRVGRGAIASPRTGGTPVEAGNIMVSPLRASLMVAVAAFSILQAADVRSGTARGERAWPLEVERLAARVRALPSDFEKVEWLRRYVGTLLDVGRLEPAVEQRYRSVDFASFDPAAFYPLFKSDTWPADCGITTFFYLKLLHAFGFSAYQYSFGFTAPPYDRFIHSVVLVDVNVEGERRLVVEDPYLNLTFRHPDGRPLDVFELFAALKRRDYGAVVVDAGTLTTALLVPDPAQYLHRLSPACQSELLTALARPDGSLAVRMPIARDIATMLRSPCDPFERLFEQAMRDHGIDEPFLYAYRLRAADMVGSSDHAAVQRRIDEARR